MIIVLLGQTGSGKTSLAHKLKQEFPSLELVNCDAFQIYKGMDVLTAKTMGEDRKNYHLMDIIEPDKDFSVKDYQYYFKKEIEPMIKDGKNILLVGGTGLYVKAALYDYVFNSEENNDTSDLTCLSNQELHGLLSSLDFLEAQKIHPNNRKRVIRAISLIRNIKQTKTSFIETQSHSLIYKDVYFYCIETDKNELHERLKQRVDEMFEDGIIEETRRLKEKYSLSLTSMQAIGYKEALAVLEGKMDIQEAKSAIYKRTKNYAKRQCTFFKHQFEGILYYNIQDLFVEISRRINDHGRN